MSDDKTPLVKYDPYTPNYGAPEAPPPPTSYPPPPGSYPPPPASSYPPPPPGSYPPPPAGSYPPPPPAGAPNPVPYSTVPYPQENNGAIIITGTPNALPVLGI